MKFTLAVAYLFALSPLITHARLYSDSDKRVLETEGGNGPILFGSGNFEALRKDGSGSSGWGYSDDGDFCAAVTFPSVEEDGSDIPDCSHVEYFIESNFHAWKPFLDECHGGVSTPEELVNDLMSAYSKWKITYGVSKLDNECKSLKTWVQKHLFILKSGAKKQSYSLGHNQNSHLTSLEVHGKYKIGTSSPYRSYYSKNSTTQRRTLSEDHFRKLRTYNLPTEKNWVEEGAITPVKNQGDCGACWAFSAAGAIEFLIYNATGDLAEVSVQEMIDCNSNGYGCDGGVIDCSFTTEDYGPGLCSAGDYPVAYNASFDVANTSQTCEDSECSVIPDSEIHGHFQLSPGGEYIIMETVLFQPVSIAIDASAQEFAHYTSGIFDSSDCGTEVDHAMLIVGYGDDDGEEYWLLKNSWGTNWGEQGYMRLSRNSTTNKGPCGIFEAPSIPVRATLPIDELGILPIQGDMLISDESQCTGPVVSNCENSKQPGATIFIQNDLPVPIVAVGLNIQTDDTTVSFGGNSYSNVQYYKLDESNGYFPVSNGTTNNFKIEMAGCGDNFEAAMTFIPTDPEYRKTLPQLSAYMSANQDGSTVFQMWYVEGNYTEEQIQKYEQGVSDGQCQACEYTSPDEGNPQYGNSYNVIYYCVTPECDQPHYTHQCSTGNLGLLTRACPTTPVVVNNQITSFKDYIASSSSATTPSTAINEQVVTMQITESVVDDYIPPVTFANFSGYWKYIGQSIDSVEITRSTSWETSNTDTITTAWSAAVSGGISFGFKENEILASEKESVSTDLEGQYSRDQTKSTTNSKTKEWSLTCDTPTCADGNLWQWRQSMTAVTDGSTSVGDYYVDFCSFVCIPSMLSQNNSAYVPKCPSTVCSDNTCQCCNRIWKGDDSNPEANYLNIANGGTCSPCNQAGSTCEVDDDCCSTYCIDNAISTCGS